MEIVFTLAVAGIFALAINLAVTPAIIRISHRRRWYDLPNGRKIHTNPIPRLGGIGIFLSFLVASLTAPGIVSLAFGKGFSFPYETRYIPVLAAICLISIIGLVDDFRDLRARNKFLLQLVAAGMVTLGGFTIHSIAIPTLGTISLGIFAYPVTVLWIVGLSNALNLVDGVDGLAGGISCFAALSMGAIFFIEGHIVSAVLAFALLGSTLSFLAFNLPPARIFMGDSGAYFLGFTLSLLPLLGGTAIDFTFNLAAAIMLLAIPIIDTASAISRRVRKRQSIGTADKEHLHHKLMDLGLKEWKILQIMYLYSIGLSAVAISIGLVQGLVGLLIFIAAWVANIAGYIILMRVKGKEKNVVLPKGKLRLDRGHQRQH